MHHATADVSRVYDINTRSLYDAAKEDAKAAAKETLAAAAGSLPEELLPFTVKLVRSEAELNKAIEIRHAAYARHLPVFAETLRKPESYDAEPGVVVLLAE